MKQHINQSLRRLSRVYGVVEYNHEHDWLTVHGKTWLGHRRDLVDGVVNRVVDLIDRDAARLKYSHIATIRPSDVWPTGAGK